MLSKLNVATSGGDYLQHGQSCIGRMLFDSERRTMYHGRYNLPDAAGHHTC